jgi:glycosyltransferase involved in cell wall biosynthesis/ribosomal protein S18 acetylase RimI-like enzyme
MDMVIDRPFRPANRIAHVATTDMTLRFLLFGQLRRLRDEGFDVTTISAPGPWSGALDAEGIRHIAWPHATRAWDPKSDARAFVELISILRRERFDLVHMHNPKTGIMGRIAARLAGVPCIVNTVHGLYATPDSSPGKRWGVLALERVASRFSDLELYQSSEDLAWARRTKTVDPSKSILIGNGADLSWFDRDSVSEERVATLRAGLGIPERAVVVGTVGRLVAEKGYREFVAAARAVKAELPDTVFVAVGGMDPEKNDAISSAEIQSVSGNVQFLGWREDVRDLLALMDIFVLASWREGVPRSAIEAAAMGLPLVVTDIRGCREVVRSGREGLLVPSRDPAALTASIARLVRDRTLRDAMGAAARTTAAEHFDEARITDRIVDLYGRLLARKGLVATATEEEVLRVREARPDDARAIARIHAQSLPAAFLPTLGERFLQHLYRALAKDPEGVLLVAENGSVVGFAGGVVSVPRFFRRFAIKHGIAASAAAMPRLLRPQTLRRFRETARYPSVTKALPASELLSIALLPSFRRSGVGTALADGVVRGLVERGAGSIKVVVDAENDAGNHLYQSLGFRLAESMSVHDGASSNVWVK